MRRTAWIVIALAFTTAAFAGEPNRKDEEGRGHHRADLMRELREADPTAQARQEEIRRLHEQIRDLAKGADQLDTKALAARRAQIEPLASKLFDLKLTERKARLALMEEKLGDRHDALETKAKDKDRIVEEKIDKLLSGETEGEGRRRGR